MLGRISPSRIPATAFQSPAFWARSSRWRIPAVESGGVGSSTALAERTASGNTPVPMALKTAPASWKNVPRDSMQASYRGPAAARSPARRVDRIVSASRRMARERTMAPSRASRNRASGVVVVTSTVSISPNGRSAISRSNRVESSRPSATIRETTRPCEATLRPASARTAPKVDPAGRSRETSQPSMRNRMEKRYDNDGGQAMEIGRERERGDQRGRSRSSRTASETIFPATCLPSTRYVPSRRADRISSIRRVRPSDSTATARRVSSSSAPHSPRSETFNAPPFRHRRHDGRALPLSTGRIGNFTRE